jgi:hypothetical protein
MQPSPFGTQNRREENNRTAPKKGSNTQPAFASGTTGMSHNRGMTKQNDSDRTCAILTLHRYFSWATTLQNHLKEAGGCLDETISEERASAGSIFATHPLIY